MGELYNPFPKLPKNIRQIGDSDPMVKCYMEDYVNTYLKRLYPTGKKTMRVGVLLGSVEQYNGVPYIFVDGAMEMEDVEVDGEKILFSESSWKKVYRQMEDSFPKRTIQGWFLCGSPGSQLSPLNYWKQHSQFFAGKNQLMYLNHGLEGDEAVYITSEEGFHLIKGYCIYYERNQMMQDYMIMRKDVRRVESGAQETVIRDFRSRLSAKKEQAALQSRAAGAMGMLCGVLTVAVLAGGVVLVNNYTKMKQMEGVLASVLPAGVENWSEYQTEQTNEDDFIIEEINGNIKPTQAESQSTEEIAEETMENGQVGVEENLIDNITNETASQTQPLVGIGKETGQGDAWEEEQEAASSIENEAAVINGNRIYVVKEGETLYGICWKYYGNLNKLAEICRLNNLVDVNRILSGQKLILP